MDVDHTYVRSMYQTMEGHFGSQNNLGADDVALVDSRNDNTPLFKQMTLQKIQIFLAIILIFIYVYNINLQLKKMKQK